MRLAIADPPYLGRGVLLYGNAPVKSFNMAHTRRTGRRAVQSDNHPEAHLWDDPETHRDLVNKLVGGYDGWAIAMAVDNLFEYLQWVPRDTRICVWDKTPTVPSGSRLTTSWEPVLVFLPHGRRRSTPGDTRPDVLHHHRNSKSTKFVGSKPAVWTRWVLDILGYDPDTDTVDDLFGGSGAVTAEINQGVLI